MLGIDSASPERPRLRNLVIPFEAHGCCQSVAKQQDKLYKTQAFLKLTLCSHVNDYCMKLWASLAVNRSKQKV